MMMKKLAFATLVAMGMSAAAIAQQPSSQQPSSQPAPRNAQPPPAQTQPRQQQPTTQATPAPRGGDRTEQGDVVVLQDVGVVKAQVSATSPACR